MFNNTFMNRLRYKLACLVLLPLCVLCSVVQATRHAARPQAPGISQHRELPADLAQQLPSAYPSGWVPHVKPLRPLALSALEQRFTHRFPGSLARLTDGQRTVVARTVDQPTRMLHPAADCYQGLGYQIAAQQLVHDAHKRLWRCFEASRTGSPRLRVCERIVDAQGQGFTDTSAWYWAALAGQSSGPWQALTVAHAL
jgi:hypothetical protein